MHTNTQTQNKIGLEAELQEKYDALLRQRDELIFELSKCRSAYDGASQSSETDLVWGAFDSKGKLRATFDSESEAYHYIRKRGDARAAWAAWDAREAWEAWAALTVQFASRQQWITQPCELLTTGIRDAYLNGLEIAIPISANTLGFAMVDSSVSDQGKGL